MPTPVQDFRPITVRTARPAHAVLRALVCWTDPFPPIPFGCTRVHLNRDGVPVPGPSGPTERYLALFRPWAVVDQREHLLDFRFECASLDGAAGLEIDVRVSVMLTEPDQAVIRRVDQMRSHLRPAVSQRVGAALGRQPTDLPDQPDRPAPAPDTPVDPDTPDTSVDPDTPVDPNSIATQRVAAMHALRRQVSDQLGRTLAPGTYWHGSFYRVVVVDCAVSFDPVTGRHLDRLVDAASTAEVNRLRRAGA